jgi:hypothetical protein
MITIWASPASSIDRMLWPSSRAARGTLRKGSSPLRRTLRISPGFMRSSLSLVRTKVMGQTSAVMSIVWSGWIVITRQLYRDRRAV